MERLDALDQNFRFVRVPWYDFTKDDENTAILSQPFLKEGSICEKGLYRNDFSRAGKVLHSEIIMRRGALKDLENIAKDIIPEKCHEAKNYLVTDSLYGQLVLDGLTKAGLTIVKIVIPADSADE